jgi:hypothetical protein
MNSNNGVIYSCNAMEKDRIDGKKRMVMSKRSH